MEQQLITRKEVVGQPGMDPELMLRAAEARKRSREQERLETQKTVEELNANCQTLSTRLTSLGEGFAKKSDSYARLVEASRANRSVYQDLGSQLRALSSELRQGARILKQNRLH